MTRHTRRSENFQYRELSPHRRGKKTSKKIQETLVYTRRARSTPPASRVRATQVEIPRGGPLPTQMSRDFAAFN